MKRAATGKYFVFLEIMEAEVLNLLVSLRQIFLGFESDSAIHLTVRGPYSYPILPEKIRRWEAKLLHEPILLANVRTFMNGEEIVVYVKVNQDKLRSIWYKPDYPVEKYGFNPHITLYKGADHERARKIERFLKGENIALMCYQYELSCYKSKDLRLFGPKVMARENTFNSLVKIGKVKFDILTRAMDAVDDDRYRSLLPFHKNPYEDV